MRPDKKSFTGDDIVDTDLLRDIARLRRERREAEQSQRPKHNQQSNKASRAYQRRPMPVRTAEGNGEERARKSSTSRNGWLAFSACMSRSAPK